MNHLNHGDIDWLKRSGQMTDVVLGSVRDVFGTMDISSLDLDKVG